MSVVLDRINGRRVTWTGAVVRDLSFPGENPNHGQYYRVSQSFRDSDTGEWGIFWRLDDDHLEAPPTNEPVYLFHGTTWDMKAAPSTVFPRGTAIVMAVVTAFVFVTANIWWDELNANLARGFVIIVSLIMIGWSWFYELEPVRGTKVGAAMMIASELRKRQNQAEMAARRAEFNQNSGILQLAAEQEAAERLARIRRAADRL